MNEFKDQVLSFVRMNGPVLPARVSKIINKDILTSSAILSELVSNKLVIISTAKIGSSPVYYVRGQEPRLQMLYNNLPEKEKEAFNLLKEKKIIRDISAEPAIRVALRSIKDFAVPLNVNLPTGLEIFWKWYLLSNEEAENIIRPLIQRPLPQRREEQQIKQPEKKIEPSPLKKEEQLPKKTETKVDNFNELINNYLIKNNIQIINKEILRKNREIEMQVKIPSALGTLDFYLIARNKKKINEGDLSLAYHKGQSNKLPILFLSTGIITKKAEKYIEKNLKGHLVFKRII